MCGIFGTTDPRSDLVLLIRENLERGAQALSLFSPNYRLVYNTPSEGVWLPTSEPWVLGHCQARTGTPNADRHPFQWGSWFVAHNGVIHNSEELFRHTFSPWVNLEPQKTDSLVIPHELFKFGFGALSKLDGTFACWAHNATEQQTYLFSWVNPIYATFSRFSSKPFDVASVVKLDEGKVYQWPQLEVVAEFEGRSHPYQGKVSSPP